MAGTGRRATPPGLSALLLPLLPSRVHSRLAQPLPPSAQVLPPEAPTVCPLGAHRVTKACGMDCGDCLEDPLAPGAGRVQGKLLDASQESGRQKRRQRERPVGSASSGGLHRVAQGIQELGEVGATRHPRFGLLGLDESLEDLGQEGHVASSRVLEVRSTAAGVPLRETPGKVCQPWVV